MERRFGPEPKLYDVFDEIVEAIGKGLPYKYVAGLCGVSIKSLGRWLSHGAIEFEWQQQEAEGAERPPKYPDGYMRDPIYADFYIASMHAKSQRILERIEKIERAGEDPKNWTALMTLLERDDPGSFGRRDTMRIVEAGAAEDDLPEDQQEKVARSLLEQRALLKRVPIRILPPDGVIDVEAK